MCFLSKRLCLALFSFSFIINSFAQDLVRARKIMDTLASPAMFGRGYVNNGTGVAANFIAGEMKNTGLQPVKIPSSSGSGGLRDYQQEFTSAVKTYPSDVNLSINSKVLKAATDFAIITGTPSVNGSFKILEIDSTLFKKNNKINRLKKRNLDKTLLLYNPSEMKGENKRKADSLIKYNYLKAGGFIQIIDKPSISWSVYSPEEVLKFPVITVLKSSLPEKPKHADVKIDLKVIEQFKLSNVIGYLPGTAIADSFVIITAHYDHLGMLGKEAYFPGANDNASGIAMMLDMASYYSHPENRLPFCMIFIAFAGEELGLKGSKYCAEEPPFELKKVKFLINLDMVGTGSEGITVVNGDQFPAYFDRMVKINADNEYLMKVVKRGESCNSDHCPFYRKGVPAVFIYSNGKEYTEYHNINDRAERVPLSEYEDIFRLGRDFINTL